MKKIIFYSLAMVVVSICTIGPVAAQQTGALPGAEQDVEVVKSLQDRIAHLEEVLGGSVEGEKWYDRLRIGALVEVEAGWGRTDLDDPTTPDEDSSDIDLATVELVTDVRIAAHVDGHVMITYEEDELFIDEGYITLSGWDKCPGYLIAGRQYIPFGWFESHFVTDPATLELGETNEGAVVVGYRLGGELTEISIGAYNGEIKETNSDDHVENFVARVVVAPVENLNFGVSYTSNLAAADSFAAVVQADLSDYVAGWSAFVTLTLFERVTLIGEYVAALEDFAAGELYDPADTEERKPAAWNMELGYAFSEKWQVALRYAGTSDGNAGGAEFLPESQYGAVVNWGVYNNTNLALEYLRSEYEGDFQTNDAVVAQLAIEF